MKHTIKMLPGECWWCGSVRDAHEMPYTERSDCFFDLDGSRDQFAPLLLSNKGRYVHSACSFNGRIKDGSICLEGKTDFEVGDGYGDLRGAYLAAMQAFFPFENKLPHSLFWTAAQYNTWIELGVEQTTENILRYARGILANGCKPGVLMIDEGWQLSYGKFEFNRNNIPDPKALLDELHAMGFKVILWITPLVSCADPYFCDLCDAGYLLKNKNGEIALRKWWQGYSAVFDLSNPKAAAYYHNGLRYLMETYGADGFKFDAGDLYFYDDADQTAGNVSAREQTSVFNALGAQYELNEFRSCWNFGGRPIVARLHDKSPVWDGGNGLDTLVPHTVAQGLAGYAYCCPDMVGGGTRGEFVALRNVDEELFVRWAQANAFMPMMQISAAPWRVLSAENAQRVLAAIQLHEQYGDVFYALARKAAATGEPIVRHMDYVFPDEGFETDNTQFMVGNDLMVAPVLQKGCIARNVHFPQGTWCDNNGNTYEGNQTLSLSADLNSVLYFTKVK